MLTQTKSLRVSASVLLFANVASALPIAVRYTLVKRNAETQLNEWYYERTEKRAFTNPQTTYNKELGAEDEEVSVLARDEECERGPTDLKACTSFANPQTLNK
ncbi:hypothetical protein DL93DRAFT_979071 [Clavulina sp. PMI_390]|nr:hypothetical protein DL93DRAFT_979071 [Clavulina sp. PMI_390]